MSDHIPFDIQSEIVKNLPVKSLLQFQSVLKQWNLFIDSSEFVKNYHINRTRHHILVQRRLGDDVVTYTSIIDDNTFPQQKHPLTAPESLNSLKYTYTYSLTSVNGLLCFFGYIESNNMMAVIWNTSIRKSVSIVIPNVFPFRVGHVVIGFGFSSDDTSDPKLVKINVIDDNTWVVEVFTLSTRVWKTIHRGALYKSCNFGWYHVFIDEIIYWGICTTSVNEGLRFNHIISFDLNREMFGEVCLSERLSCAYILVVTKANESLRLLGYYKEGEIWVCGVCTRRDGVNKPFTKIYTLEVEGKYLLNRVLGFRNNGEVVLAMDDDNDAGYNLEVYEPSSRHINGVGINNKYGLSAVYSYTETLI